jgi:hypothetical protein
MKDAGMIRRRTILGVGVFCVLAFLAAPLPGAAEAAGPQAEAKAVQYRIVGPGDFQSFIKNWDDKKQPVLYALIQTPAQWNSIFHPAPVMGKNRPFGPDEKEFEKDQLLVIGRVMFPPATDKVFQVEKVSATAGELVLSYGFDEPKTPQSYNIKYYLGVWVPKHAYNKVIFIENGKHIGALDVSKGQWSVPPMNPEPDMPDAGGGK